MDHTGKRTFILAHDPATAPVGLERCVAVIGNFDGVHRGHREVLERGRALAKRSRRPCAVLSFEPHPADFFTGRPVIFRLTPEPAKVLILERLGLDGLVVLRFGEALAAQSAADFIEDVIVRRLNASGVVVGFDFQFGAGRRGSPALLTAAGRARGFAVEVVEKVADLAGAEGDAVHSTAIRCALEKGDIARAARLLGHDWFVLGEVRHGRKVGRTLGFPTANLALDASCRLRPGIYAVRARWGGGAARDAVASFGVRPMFDSGPPLLEVHLLDFEGDLYGQTLEVTFIAWIRPEQTFKDVPELVERMGADVEIARAALAERQASNQAR